MSIFFNQVRGLSVISHKSGDLLGRVEDLVVDPETGKFLALVVLRKLSEVSLVKLDKIKEFNHQAVTVLNNQSLEKISSGEIFNIIQNKIKIKGNKVITESGTRLGRVIDYEIDLVSNKLSTIFVRTKILGKPLIISRNQIISIGKEAIIVRDQVIKIAEPELAGI